MSSRSGFVAVAAFAAMSAAGVAAAQGPVKGCDAAGIGATALTADGAVPQITEVSTGRQASVNYCLVKVRVPEAINIWVGLPMDGAWNGRWQSVGGGVYAGAVSVPGEAIAAGYAAAATDTGHAGGRQGVPVPFLDGSFGMKQPGEANEALQRDFAYRSVHLMAVIGKQLVKSFYGVDPKYAYWNGCSTGGRQGLRMAQDFPGDYDGILAGAPAIHWDRFQAAMLWYPVVAKHYNGGPVGGGRQPALDAKLKLATDRAIAACDDRDGVKDGVLDDPRQCGYLAATDATLTRANCTAESTDCLTPDEAKVIDASWTGPVYCPGGRRDCDAPASPSRDLRGNWPTRMWYGQLRGTDLSALGGVGPFPVATEQPKYWVYFDPDWSWEQLTTDNFLAFFRDSVKRVGPLMGSDNPDLRGFRQRGGKLVIWHGWSDQLINATGSIDYYERVMNFMGGQRRTQAFARLFMAPGVAHCAGGNGPQPQKPFDAVVNWVENGVAPDTLPASKAIGDASQTRPLCPYPAVARWNGQGSSDDAANFRCARP
jgi:hypothetical protein